MTKETPNHWNDCPQYKNANHSCICGEDFIRRKETPEEMYKRVIAVPAVILNNTFCPPPEVYGDYHRLMEHYRAQVLKLREGMKAIKNSDNLPQVLTCAAQMLESTTDKWGE